MGRKKKELPLLEGLEITAVAAEGKALARYGEMVVFIPYGAPGDIADVKIDRKKHSYAEGHIERLVKPSPLRTEPFCAHFGVCGGCGRLGADCKNRAAGHFSHPRFGSHPGLPQQDGVHFLKQEMADI